MRGKKTPFLVSAGIEHTPILCLGGGVARNTEFGEGRGQTRQKKSVFNLAGVFFHCTGTPANALPKPVKSSDWVRAPTNKPGLGKFPQKRAGISCQGKRKRLARALGSESPYKQAWFGEVPAEAGRHMMHKKARIFSITSHLSNDFCFAFFIRNFREC